MTIKFSGSAPKGQLIAIQNHLNVSHIDDVNKAALDLSEQDILEVTHGLQTWGLQIEPYAKFELANVTPIGWKYILLNNQLGYDEINLGQGQQAQVTSVVTTPASEAILLALKSAEQLQQDRLIEYEPRLLQLNQIAVTALWLHSQGQNDVFIICSGRSMAVAFDRLTLSSFDSLVQAQFDKLWQKLDAAPGDSGGGPSSNITTLKSDLVADFIPTLTFAIKQSLFEVSDTAVKLNLVMQTQGGDYWCWVAVASSIADLLDSGPWPQCELATACLDLGDCCANMKPCDQPWYLQSALEMTGNLSHHMDGVISLDEIIYQIDSGLPVCTRIDYGANVGHFVVVSGYIADTLIIDDPLNVQTRLPYDQFVTAYNGTGRWVRTYFCF